MARASAQLVEEVAGDVAAVDRLDHRGDAGGCGLARGLLEVGDEGLAARALVHQACHHVDQLAAGGVAVAERRLQVGVEVLLAAGQGGAPALSLRRVAGGGVDQRQRQPVGFQLGRDLGGRGLVGVADLDGLEAGLGRRLEAVEQRHLGEQEIQVGAEAGHALFPSTLVCSNPRRQRAVRGRDSSGRPVPVTWISTPSDLAATIGAFPATALRMSPVSR